MGEGDVHPPQQQTEVKDSQKHTPAAVAVAGDSTAGDAGKGGPVMAERFKTRMCQNYERTGTCPYEVRCMFAHGMHDLRTKEMNIASGLTTEEAIKSYQRVRMIAQRTAEKKRKQAAKRAAAEAEAAAAAALAAEAERSDHLFSHKQPGPTDSCSTGDFTDRPRTPVPIFAEDSATIVLAASPNKASKKPAPPARLVPTDIEIRVESALPPNPKTKPVLSTPQLPGMSLTSEFTPLAKGAASRDGRASPMSGERSPLSASGRFRHDPYNQGTPRQPPSASGGAASSTFATPLSRSPRCEGGVPPSPAKPPVSPLAEAMSVKRRASASSLTPTMPGGTPAGCGDMTPPYPFDLATGTGVLPPLPSPASAPPVTVADRMG